MQKLTSTVLFGLVVCSLISLVGCSNNGDQTPLTPQQTAAIKAYHALPPAVQVALTQKNLQGYSFTIMVNELVAKKEETGQLSSLLTESFLSNGAVRAEKGQTPDFICSLDSSKPSGVLEQFPGGENPDQIHLSLKDTKHDTVLIDGMFDSDDALADDLYPVIKSLGDERANILISKAEAHQK